MRYFALLSAVFLFISAVPVWAQVADDAGYQRRLELAKQMHEISPVRDQVDKAIEQVARAQPADQRQAFTTAMQKALNYKAIEKVSIDAMADIYTEAELTAMIEYYSKPEAKSASAKEQDYAGKVYPEIVRMLDRAMMRVKTGDTGP